MTSETNNSRKQSAIRRTKYKELLEFGSTVESTAENDGAINTLKRISKIVKKSDELNAEGRYQDRVENTTEVVMDAQVMKMTHEIMGSIIQSMDATEISDDEFVAAINRAIGSNRDWDQIGLAGMECSNTFYYSPSLFGTFDEETVITQKEIKERRKHTKANNTQQVKPIDIGQSQKDEQPAEKINLIIGQIIQICRLNKNKSVPYYKLIIDPNNFMNTIHNAFQISFLFRDGVIALEEDEFGYPTVRIITESDKETFDDRTHQMVSNLTTKLVDEMIQRYNITEPSLLLNHS
jgi:DNA-binding transcriptional regulator YhcF (GntR family)